MNYGDWDGDGFIEYAQHGNRKGLVQQGWKDSNDSVFHADGTLAKAPIALVRSTGLRLRSETGRRPHIHALGDGSAKATRPATGGRNSAN